ncbi:hypothetical protein FDO65_14120 [Nakamurella flava]|uniref:Uncharacterized protein n=1 Tax=Nakamurella flava TaxID=2576308 RepID=A0A4U6QEI7_9ACTN|nr:hypothetical protein [Nakamurella flava]TKV58657.1 hypothetical protein FDO65_14120 [Nakamurella flava]
MTSASRADDTLTTSAPSVASSAPSSSRGSATTRTPTTTARPSTPASSEVLGAGTTPGSAPAPAGWSIVAPAGLQSWDAIPGDDISWGWHSGNCVVVVSAPQNLPEMTDERFARAHAKYSFTAFAAEVDPTMTETGEARGQETDPLRVSDPTRVEPPAVHLQLSGFRFEFPTIGVTDQTYSFVTQGGGQGFAVSVVCSTADFTARYDSEIAPFISDLGVDTGI